jgi:hypothetical protein
MLSINISIRVGIMVDDDKRLDELVGLYERAMERPELTALVDSAMSEFLVAEGAIARASAAEALAFRMMDKKFR